MNRHDLDWFSLFAGLLFAGLGTAFLIDSFGTHSADLAWVLPIALIVFGLAGVVSTIARPATPTPAPAMPTAPAEAETEVADDETATS